MLKKVLVLALAASSILLAKDINIAVVTHGQDADSFWGVVKNGVLAAEKDMGVKVNYRNPPSGDLTEMSRIISSVIAKRPDALVVSIPDADALSAPVAKAVKLGIPVVTINAGEEAGRKLGALLHAGQSNYTAGFKAGEKAKKDGVKTFVCVNQEITNVSLEERCKGFAEALGVKNNMLDVGGDPGEIEKKVKAKVDQYDAILTLGPVGAAPVIKLLEKENAKSGKHKYFVTFDLSKEIVKAIKEGTIDFAIDQQQFLQGYMPIVILTQYIKYGLLQSGDVNTGPGFVTKENAGLVEKYAGKYR